MQRHETEIVIDALAAILGPDQRTIAKAKQDYQETEYLAQQEMAIGMILTGIQQAERASRGN